MLAVEKEKAKDFKGALQEYSEWVTRNVTDEVALKSMHRLADQQKDTAALMDALVRLTRKKGVEPVYVFQLAEVDYVRSGNIAGIEKLVKSHPKYSRGKVILIKSYYKKGAFSKMVPFLPFLKSQAESRQEPVRTPGRPVRFHEEAGPGERGLFRRGAQRQEGSGPVRQGV